MVYGRARGYQKGFPLGFYGSEQTIDQNHAAVLLITYGSSPPQHIWAFVNGHSEQESVVQNYPCAIYPGNNPPTLVGKNYYCESFIV